MDEEVREFVGIAPRQQIVVRPLHQFVRGGLLVDRWRETVPVVADCVPIPSLTSSRNWSRRRWMGWVCSSGWPVMYGTYRLSSEGRRRGHPARVDGHT